MDGTRIASVRNFQIRNVFFGMTLTLNITESLTDWSGSWTGLWTEIKKFVLWLARRTAGVRVHASMDGIDGKMVEMRTEFGG